MFSIFCVSEPKEASLCALACILPRIRRLPEVASECTFFRYSRARMRIEHVLAGFIGRLLLLDGGEVSGRKKSAIDVTRKRR